MGETLITFNTAKLAKEKGFGIPVRSMYLEEKLYSDTNSKGNYNDVKWVRTWRNSPVDDTVSGPTQSLLQKWLRKTHGIKLWCAPHEYSSSDGWAYNLLAYKEGVVTVFRGNQASSVHLTYEQALEEGLQEALKHI